MPSPSRTRTRSSAEDLLADRPEDGPPPRSTSPSLDHAQRDQDVQAALHFARARSRTVDQSAAEPIQVGSPGGAGASGAEASADHGTGPDHRRRDAAQKQMEQDVRFFSPEGLPPSSPSGGHHHPHHYSRSSGTGADEDSSRPINLGRDSAGRPPTLHHQAAQARLYRHHRNLSDASLDSSHGAFIDHRQQSHSLGSSAHQPVMLPSRSPGQRGGGRSALREEVVRANRADRDRRTSDLLTGDGDDDDFALSDPVLPVSPRSPRQAPGGPDRPSNLSLSRPDSPVVGGSTTSPRMSASVATARPSAFDSSTLQGSAIIDDADEFDDMLDHRPHPASSSVTGQQHLSPSMATDSAARRHYSRTSQVDGPDVRRFEGDAGSMLTSSRRPSQAEEDVCFPTFQDHPGPGQLDLSGPLEGGRGIPGILPNFPFPFDFSALEEHADKERETWSLGSGGRHEHGAGGVARPAAVSVSADLEGVRRRTAFGASPKSALGSDPLSPDSNGGHGPEKRGRIGMLKQRRLSESVGPRHGRQRKLALFENSGHSNGGPNELVPTRTKTMPAATVLDSKAPLLGKIQRGYSSASAGGQHGRTQSHVDRPYRFSFYSNALPATIHARSLAEIPADGQTFEELFTGRSPSRGPGGEDAWEGSTDPAGGGAGSGANTGAHGTPLQRGAELSSDRGGGANGQWTGKRSSAQNSSATGTTATATSGKDGMTAAQAMANLGAAGRHASGADGAAGGPGNHHHHARRGKQKSSMLMRSDEDAEENTWWLDVLCPTDQEMKVLSKVFGIHPLTTEDIQMEETREKIELFRNYYLVCFRSFDQDPYSPTYLEPLNMYIIVFREGTLSFHFRGTPHPQNVRRRIKQLKDYINVTSDWISYALIDDITDAFGPLIQSIEYEVDSIDELVLILKDAEQSDMLRRIGMCRKKVMGLLRLMGNKADVVKGLAKRCNENWSVAPKSDIGLYLSDIQDHLVTMTQNLNHYEKILSRSHSNYLASISIDMTEANNQINDVLSKLTALGSILVPMNLVTGLWGMNVHVPGQDIETGYTWFVSIVAALITFGILGAWGTLKYFSATDNVRRR